MVLFQALSKVPNNVAHFAELGVYKQMRKKLPGTEKDMFPHLPRPSYPLVGDPTIQIYHLHHLHPTLIEI
jgi:hypothetical protein